MASITVYGADWCSLTKLARRFLDKKGVKYKYVNIDEDKTAAKWVAEQSGGKEKKPTIDIDGKILVEPSNEQLEEALAVV